jgi:signal transduction histidine kinase
VRTGTSALLRDPTMTDRLPPTSPIATDAPPAPGPLLGSAERRTLMAEFVTAGELERRRVAESIHDDSIQAIAAMGMRLQMLRRVIDDPEQLALLADAEEVVRFSIARLRHLVYELHPPGLEQEGLASALALALDVPGADGDPVHVLDDQLSSAPGSSDSAILFRVAQEALANVREHAAATRVTVSLLERDGGYAVRIADDGCGFDLALAAPDSTGYGFASMRARAHLGGGRLRVDSVPGEGTTVEVWLPGTPDAHRNGSPHRGISHDST